MPCARVATVLLVLSLLLGAAAPVSAAQAADSQWFEDAGDGEVDVTLWFFWSETCPHCHRAKPVVEGLAEDRPWLILNSLEVSRDEDNSALYVEMATALGHERLAVPAFAFCGAMSMGFDEAATTGVAIADALDACHAWAIDHREELFGPDDTGTSASPPTTLPAVDTDDIGAIPLLGDRDPAELSLPMLTLVIAGLDAFNPCAFFVLLFLLSLMVHAKSRARMLAVGGVFVLFSGLVYFAFMAAWLNLFLVTGELRAITLVAGVIAVALALVNLKDVFLGTERGPSLSMSDAKKPRLFERIRRLVSAERIGPMIAGTIVLALAANAYELLCTTGFPLVYTRILTLEDLPTPTFYGYLAAYNVIYVIPLLAIVVVFTATLGSRKLSEFEGRVLKLVSGLMMLGLGGILVFAPEALNDLRTAGLLVAGTVLVATVVLFIDRRRAVRPG